jgi:hypothetical protein
MHRKAEEEGALVLGADQRQRHEAPPGRREPDCPIAGRFWDVSVVRRAAPGGAGTPGDSMKRDAYRRFRDPLFLSLTQAMPCSRHSTQGDSP